MKLNSILILIVVQLAFATEIYSQAEDIIVTGNMPATSAVPDISCITKGLLTPRITTTQQNAILLPATGLLNIGSESSLEYYGNNQTVYYTSNYNSCK